ncbi:DMT family transporter [Roseicella frigidaeris]|uniref:DMT family transporter n=1 Tax=Roseicella frigidaeris TaxID=2230885 RepID=UPI0024373C12|nr:EamA family transporter [Roseicella frigidaeris]
MAPASLDPPDARPPDARLPAAEPPTARDWAALGIAILASQAGQVLLKLGALGLPPLEGAPLASLLAQILRVETLLGLGCYGSGTLFYVVALRRIPMSVAAPCTAISYVSATLFGVLLFGEALSPLKLGGLALVCLGVLLLADFAARRPARADLTAPAPAVSASR